MLASGPTVVPATDRDPTLAEQHRLRERDHAAGAERVERAGAAMARADRAEPRHTGPGGVDRVSRDALDVLAQHRARIRRWRTRTRFRSVSGCSTTSPRWATFADALRLGIDEVAATGRLDRDVEFVERQSRGLALGERGRGRARLRRARQRGRGRDRRSVDLRQRTHRRAIVRRGPHSRDQLLGRRAHARVQDHVADLQHQAPDDALVDARSRARSCGRSAARSRRRPRSTTSGSSSTALVSVTSSCLFSSAQSSSNRSRIRKIAGIRCFSASSSRKLTNSGSAPETARGDPVALLGRGEVGAEEEHLQVAVLGDRVGELAELLADLVELAVLLGDAEQGVGVDARDLLHYRPPPGCRCRPGRRSRPRRAPPRPAASGRRRRATCGSPSRWRARSGRRPPCGSARASAASRPRCRGGPRRPAPRASPCRSAVASAFAASAALRPGR